MPIAPVVHWDAAAPPEGLKEKVDAYQAVAGPRSSAEEAPAAGAAAADAPVSAAGKCSDMVRTTIVEGWKDALPPLTEVKRQP